MASAGDVYTALEKFELDLIEKQWADDIWSSEFTSCPDDLPDEFSEKFSPLSYCDIVQVIDQANRVINAWLNDSTDAPSDTESTTSSVMGPSWTCLQEFDYKKLLAVLYYYISKGQLNNQDFTAVHVCIKATNFYFTLLMIPGSNIYKVFHLTLFEKCMETFQLHKYLEIATGTMIKKTKNTRKNDDGGDNLGSDDEFLEMDETLPLSQQYNVVKLLNLLMTTFQQLVGIFSFKKYPEALNISLNILAELSRIERNSTLQEFSTNNSSNSCAPLSRNAYLTMKEFCSEMHGKVSEIIRLVLYYILPNLTSIGGPAIPEMAKFNNKELTNIRNIAVSFITDNIVPMGEKAHWGLKILIQQICFNMIDRADYRTKATEMVFTLMSKLPMDLYYAIMKWIFRLTMMEGAHHRVIGLELLSKFIYMKPGTTEMSQMNETYNHSQIPNISSQLGISPTVVQNRSDTLQRSDTTNNYSQDRLVSFSQPVNYVPLEYRRAMLAIIIDRIRDEAATVRTRALSIVSDLITNRSSPSVLQLMQEIFIKPYLNLEFVKENPEAKENDFMKWKTFVVNLDKVREPGVSKTMVPGGRVIVKKIFEKCLDERVNVRKSALQVISRIFKFNPKWMTTENLELFGRHCRDPALSVRKEMVGSITELMLVFPDHELIMKLWVEEVVPQIIDREIRVQEQVLQVLTQTILSKITTFERTNTSMDELPWKLMNRIAQQKMRSFVITACASWYKSGNLSQNLVKTLKTHVGTANNGAVWVLLSSMSEYLDIDKPDFVKTYYVDVVAKGSDEPAISHLALITLNNCWHKLDQNSLELIQTTMFANLESKSVHPTLIGLTVDIATGILVYTAEDEREGKKEVAKWAVKMIQEAESHLQTCLKSRKQRTSDCKDCIPILSLLGALAGICPENIEHTTFQLLYNYLMDSGNETKMYDRNMRATTVITLAKMALRCDFFARSLVAGLSQLLATSSDPILLNNVIVSIADIGERYANLIEPLISSISICLKSKYKSLKEITLILLIELLQEDYLKARGALVFHLLSLVNDSDPRAVNIVKYYFTNCLLARKPYTMYQLLMPSLFHFNNYTSHPDYPKPDMSDAESKSFDLSGPSNHEKRMNIYRFMLSNIPNMVLMKCLHFICTVVLNGVADNIISIKSKSGEQLLFDALSILLTKEIKLEYNELVGKKNDDGEEDQRQNPDAEELHKIGKKLFTAVQKKEIIELVIPICCKLRKKLVIESKKFLPYLHKFVREMVKEYKDEINEIFKEDKQFGIEILHEIQKMTENEDQPEEDDEENDLVVHNKETEGQENGIENNAGQESSRERDNAEPVGIPNAVQNEINVLQTDDVINIQNENEAHVTPMEVDKEANAIADHAQVHLAAVIHETTGRKSLWDKQPMAGSSNGALNKNEIDGRNRDEATEPKKIVPVNFDEIEEYDSDRHAPSRRRSSAAEWRRQSNSESVEDVARRFEVRAQVEKLSIGSDNDADKSVVGNSGSKGTKENNGNVSILKEAVVSLERLSPDLVESNGNVLESRSPPIAVEPNQAVLKEAVVSSERLNSCEGDDANSDALKEAVVSSERSSPKTVNERRSNARKVDKEAEAKKATSSAVANESNVAVERLSAKCVNVMEKTRQNDHSYSEKREKIETEKRTARKKSEELTASLERLDPKYVSELTKTNRKHEDGEKAIEKGVKKIIMPPPNPATNVKKNKKVFTPKGKKASAKASTPQLDEAGNASLLTSTPMIAVSSDKEFDKDLSPIIDN